MERLRPLLGDPPGEQRGVSQARIWQRDGAAQIVNSAEMPDVEALSALVQGLHLVVDQLLLGKYPYQALVALLPEMTPHVHSTLIRVYGGPSLRPCRCSGAPATAGACVD